MKFKTQEQLDGWIGQKRSVDYKTDLIASLTEEEIEIILNKPSSTTIGEYNRIKDKFESRVTKILELICGIEGQKFSGWDYGSDESDREEPFVLDSRVYVYLYDQIDNISNVFDNMIPIQYLKLDKRGIVNFYLSSVGLYHSELIQKKEKVSNNRKASKEKYMNTLLSIKSKVSPEEFKFVVGKRRLTKGEKKSLIG